MGDVSMGKTDHGVTSIIQTKEAGAVPFHWDMKECTLRAEIRIQME